MGKFKLHTKYQLKDGTIVPSTTTVTNETLGWNKSVLMNWGIRMVKEGKDPQKMTSDAAQTGTLAHALCEAWIKGEDYAVPEEYTEAQEVKAMKALMAFKEWAEQARPEFLDTELKMVSEKMRAGGTCDGIFKMNDRLYLYDIKTSKGVYEEMKVQLGCYTGMYEELFPDRHIHGGVILRLDKESGDFHYHAISRETMDIGFKIFKHCRSIYHLKREL